MEALDSNPGHQHGQDAHTQAKGHKLPHETKHTTTNMHIDFYTLFPRIYHHRIALCPRLTASYRLGTDTESLLGKTSPLLLFSLPALLACLLVELHTLRLAFTFSALA